MLTFVVFTNVKAQDDTSVVQKTATMSLNQMVNTLSACECFIKSIRTPLSAEEHRLIAAYGVMSGLDFRTLDSLYQHSNEIIKLYSFGLICSNFPDSLTDQHMKLLKNKHKIELHQKPQDDFPKERISSIAYEMYAMIEKKKQDEITHARVEEKLNLFISTYALYPESYIPISFTGHHDYAVYSGASVEKEFSVAHVVVHNYKLKTSLGELVTVNQVFKLNLDFLVLMIETVESGTISYWPPQLDLWLNQFGRSLTEQDREQLRFN